MKINKKSSKITYNNIPDFGNPNKSEEEKKKDTMMAWVGMTSVEDLEKEDRKKFLDAISGVKKKASNPTRIPESLPKGVADALYKKLIEYMNSEGVDFVWLTHNLAYAMSDREFQRRFGITLVFNDKDMSGRQTVNYILGMINPLRENQASVLELEGEEKTKYGLSKDDPRRVNEIYLIFGKNTFETLDEILYILEVEQGRSRSAINEVISQHLWSSFYSTASHEITHAYDIITQKENVNREYQTIMDIEPEDTTEERRRKSDFYYTSRTELKSYINETISQAISEAKFRGLNNILNNDFIGYFEKVSPTFHDMREELSVRPGDEERTFSGKTMKKIKEDAWKKYLRTLYSWWVEVRERAATLNENGTNLDVEANNNYLIKKLSRIIRSMDIQDIDGIAPAKEWIDWLKALPQEGRPAGYKIKQSRGDTCCWCGRTGLMSVEHIIPRGFGGPAAKQWNLSWSCYPCNDRRGDLIGPPPRDWMKSYLESAGLESEQVGWLTAAMDMGPAEPTPEEIKDYFKNENNVSDSRVIASAKRMDILNKLLGEKNERY